MNKVLLHKGSLDNFIHKGLITPFLKILKKGSQLLREIVDLVNLTYQIQGFECITHIYIKGIF